jgi:formate dehydrogenase subunit delta
MSVEKITRMANDIAKFMESKPHDEGMTLLAAHINDFWVIDAGPAIRRPVAEAA